VTPARPAVPSLSCVVLTRGDRPVELARAVDSVRRQQGAAVQVVVVVNGAAGAMVPPGVDVLELPDNLGIPGGRNAGVQRATGDVVLFLDDDGWLPEAGVADRLRALFAEDTSLGVVSLRIVDPETGATERRHVPRLRAGEPGRSSEVTTFLGGACAIRRAALDRCGPFADGFFYGHEETDFAWAALDAGYRVRYEAGLVMYHPGGAASARHAMFYRLTARNRVWLARRRLPAPLVPVYLLVWTALTVVRERRAVALRPWLGGFVAGLREPAGPRQPIRWRTVWRMTRLGRPPVI